MRNMIMRADYCEPAYWIESIELEISLVPECTQVTNTMHIVRNKQRAPEPLVLDGCELMLEMLSLNGTILRQEDYLLDEHSLTLSLLPDEFTLTITTLIHPDKNTSLEGLYLSNGIFCTQCEASGFQHITYYLDRPDVMSRFTTRIIADKKAYPCLLSNGNLIEQGDLENGKHFVVWQDPFKKPCYLFALVAGDLDCLSDIFTTQSGRVVALRIFVEKGFRERCHHAMASLKQAMRWDEQKYGREYDLDVFMMVAVSDFNMGAMENKGLNIFNAKYILADQDSATDRDFEGIQLVIGHEYFHNWTGNRITCRDWFQLSLKEGLTVFREQEFTADMTSQSLSRIDDVTTLRANQFPEDDGPLAHPVRPDSYIEVNNLYTATVYEKGAELIRMQQTLLTPEGFRRGMDCYFDRHDGQAVTCDDFVQALADANQVDLQQFKLWYSQAGTPTVKISTHYDPEKQEYELTLSQSCPLTPEQAEKKPFHIPLKMALFSREGEKLVLRQGQTEQIIELKAETETYTFKNITTMPVLSILRHYSAPVKLDYRSSIDDNYTLFYYDDDAFNRWEAGQHLAFIMLDRFMESYEDGRFCRIDQRFAEGLSRAFTGMDADPGLNARILMLPTMQQMSERFEKDIPVERIKIAHDTLREDMAICLYEKALSTYQQLNTVHSYQFTPLEVGRRSLKYACLYYLVHSGNEEGLALAIAQYHQANNMTDRLAALRLVTSSENDSRSILLENFYSRWQHDSLTLDKWFTLQAIGDLPDIIDNLRLLLRHPGFNYKNPNKVRALIGAFSTQNFAHFHAMDGSGYFFLAEQVCILDKINPQVAARLVTPLTSWQRHISLRQSLMKDALETILSEPKLSNNVFEMVSKSFSKGI
ncbi:MAG: aminopeptidase N [Legionellales bacterium]|nr:aminopeptidase N [Legionellales bacterium]